MPNESLIQVPTDVAEPIVLQRFLLRLVEELDIILGKRGDSKYLSQEEVTEAIKELTDRLTVLEQDL